MVREITMFELHFDGARFGPTFGEQQESADRVEAERDATDGEVDAGSSGPGVGRLLAVVGAVAVASLVVRRVRGGGESDLDVEAVESVADR